MTSFAPPRPGSPNPLGATFMDGGTNFALFSENATGVDLCLFSPDGKVELARVPLPEHTNGIWHGFMPDVLEGQLYGYRVHGPYAPQDGHRFNAHKLLIDPYTRRLSGAFRQHDALFGYATDAPQGDLSFNTQDSAPYMPKCVVSQPDFRWGKDKPPQVAPEQTIIYETHIKGISQLHTGVPVKKRGTFEGLSSPRMLDHLVKLGVTSVELLPIQAFFSEPRLTKLGLTNYWGYNPAAYFAPEACYLGPAGVHSFQRMVKALHSAGIEVILDVVYNHTAESWELGPTLSWRGIDNKSYYRLDAENPRYYVNDTGCGNTLNTNHPRVLQMVTDSLRYWVEEMHVDGFRFDLATTMARTPEGFRPDSAFLIALQQDPVLSRVKLIAEPWDIGPGGYQLGAFPSGWAEWNDRFRDDARAFWRGDKGAAPALAARMLGSADIFDHGARKAQASVNFITSHDGFTLKDTVSFNEKHNEANLEENRDGHNHNISDNCGEEGPTADAAILERRAKRARNLLVTLFTAQGTPMLLAGDEIGHSQKGNNNAYCQDNEITWLNWRGLDQPLLDFTRQLIAFRQQHPVFNRLTFMHGAHEDTRGIKDVTWLTITGNEMTAGDWHDDTLAAFGLMLSGTTGAPMGANGKPLIDDDFIVYMNAGEDDLTVNLPTGMKGTCVLNTANIGQEFEVDQTSSGVLSLPAESVIIICCKDGVR
ncbi:glycogen debranching protein GlgX [Kordiimonas sp.]|uniref:glycogen debranching protein GlgX n=1 Tax=Kordiimonas sp. TaxID=1970157 RepID=UPI003A9538EE